MSGNHECGKRFGEFVIYALDHILLSTTSNNRVVAYELLRLVHSYCLGTVLRCVCVCVWSVNEVILSVGIGLLLLYYSTSRIIIGIIPTIIIKRIIILYILGLLLY